MSKLYHEVGRRITAVSLRVKIAGMVACVVLALGLTTALFVRAHLVNILDRRLDTHALVVAQAVAAHHADAMRSAAGVTSHSLLAGMVESDPEVLYAIVHDADGQVLVRAARPDAPPEALAAEHPSPEVAAHTRAVETSAGKLREAIVPVEGVPAYVRVGVSEAGVEAAIAAMSRNLALMTALALLIAVLLSLGLTQLLTRPILSLQRAVRSTSLADLPGHAEPVMEDEIGELTRAFNAMIAGLARARDALVIQNRELVVLNATAQAISGSLDLEQILHAALREVLDQMRLKAGWIFLTPDAAHGEPGMPGLDGAQPLSLVLHAGLSDAFARQEAECDFTGCVSLEVLTTGQCRIMSNLCDQCRRLGREAIVAEGLVAHASIPLIARDHVVGVLNVAADAPRAFRDEEVRLLCSIGRQVGVAIDNVRLWEQVRRKEQLRGQLLQRIMDAQEEERRRIALELHDQTGSALASLGVGLRMLEDSVALPRAARAQLAELKDQAASIARSLHRLALDLRPLALDRLGLAEAVEQSVRDFARQHGTTTDFQALGLDEERLPSEVEVTLYRIVQEALTNVAKHAGASEVGVVLERRADSVVAIVEDNGRGFDVAQALAADPLTSKGPYLRLGLFGMQERAGRVGGRWQIESTPGEGTTVFVEVPL